MHITWYGQGCFKIQTKEKSILIDPFEPSKTGLRLPRTTEDIVLISQLQKEYSSLKRTEDTFLISSPGEYEITGIFIYGFSQPEDYPIIIYRLEIEGLSIVHLSRIQHLLNDEIIGELDGVDILMIPVGGKEVLTTDKAAKIISQLESKIVIPMYYKIPGLKLGLEDITKFYKEMGIKKVEPIDKLSVKAKSLPQETEIVVLKV